MSEKINEIKEFCDYILKLEDENKELENTCKSWFEKYHELRKRKNFEIHKMQQRIDKAIEFYKKHQQECVIGRNKDEKLIKEYYLPAQCSKKILDILKGDD